MKTARTTRMNLPMRLLNTKHVKHLLARALVCSMLLVLPSCSIPHFRQAEPGPALPASFNGGTSPDNSAQLGIGDFFNDPMLLRLLDEELAGNRELKILDEEVQIASNEVLARQGAYLPFVTFRGESGLEKNSVFTPLGAAEEQLEYRPGKHFPNPPGNFLLGFNLFWQLDIWRELRDARDAAAQRSLAAKERRNYFVTRLVAEVAENYFGLMSLDKRLEYLGTIIELQEQSRKAALARKEAGRGTELAVQRFQAEVRKNQSERL